MKNRDFVDFLCLLYVRKLSYLVLLLIMLAFAWYFNNSSNARYKFDVDLEVSLSDNYYITDNYQIQLYKLLWSASSKKKNAEVDINTLQEAIWSRRQVSDMIERISINSQFLLMLADKYLVHSSNKNLSRKDLSEIIRSSITSMKNGHYGHELKLLFKDQELSKFINANFLDTLNEYISFRIKTHLVRIKNSALSVLASDKENIMPILNGGVAEYEISNYKYNFVKSYKIPDTYKFKYFDSSSDYSVTTIINPIILYLAIFISSLFLHIIISILVDLKDQVVHRIRHEEV